MGGRGGNALARWAELRAFFGGGTHQGGRAMSGVSVWAYEAEEVTLLWTRALFEKCSATVNCDIWAASPLGAEELTREAERCAA